MGKFLGITLVLILCAGLSGCITLETADADPTLVPTETPAAGTAETLQPPGAPVQETSPAPAQGGMPAGLSAYYPWERVPLPEGSEFIKMESVEDTDKYIEHTYLSLPMTKTEAVAYFTQLLEKDAELYNLDDDLPYVPLEIQGAYPDVVSFASLYGRYTEAVEPNVYIVIVNLYTPADGETISVATVQVNYRTKP